MKVCIHQPSYWAWLGLLDKIAKSDKFIVLDNVSANKASYQYRNQFFCNGQSKIITLPVNYSMGIKLNDLRFKNNSWKDKHLDKISNYYIKSPYFESIFPEIRRIYDNYQEDLVFPFIWQTMKYLLQIFNIDVDIVFSSSLQSDFHKGELVIDLCKKTNADIYLSGNGGKDYIDNNLLNSFSQNKISVEWHSFNHPVYMQHRSHDFIFGLSSLDILFWNGIDKSRKLFWGNVNKHEN